jgi:hypothetical protein
MDAVHGEPLAEHQLIAGIGILQPIGLKFSQQRIKGARCLTAFHFHQVPRGLDTFRLIAAVAKPVAEMPFACRGSAENSSLGMPQIFSFESSSCDVYLLKTH